MSKFSPQFNNPTQVVTIPNFFSDNEIQHIKNITNSLPSEEGRAGSVVEIRRSKVKWLEEENSSCSWVFKKLKSTIEEVNSFVWKFNLKGWNDNIQYAEYSSTDQGYFDWHLDIGDKVYSHRKLSLTIQLSDPNEYEGGEFQTFTAVNPISQPSTKGTLILFPTFLLHRVTPVTQGLRKSLVWWVGGAPLK